MRYLLSILFPSLLLLTVFSCKKKDESEDTSEMQITMMDQSYGTDVKQKFNIYLPAFRSKSSTPVIFLIHGGAWRSGDRTDFNSSIATYQAMFPNYAIVTLSYRLYANNTNRFPVQEMDVKSCIEYVMIHRADYEISQKFAIIGVSAGAHLGALYAYKYGSTSYNPKAVVEISGPMDLIKTYTTVNSAAVKSWISDVAGNPYTADSLTYISSSPLHFVSPTSAPTLILHGTADTIVPAQQASLLDSKLQANNVIRTMKLYVGDGHTLGFNASQDAMSQIQTFLNTHLN